MQECGMFTQLFGACDIESSKAPVLPSGFSALHAAPGADVEDAGRLVPGVAIHHSNLHALSTILDFACMQKHSLLQPINELTRHNKTDYSRNRITRCRNEVCALTAFGARRSEPHQADVIRMAMQPSTRPRART